MTAEVENPDAGVDLSAFPIVPFPEEGTEPQWIRLDLTWESNNPAAWDGKTLAVQVMGNGGDSSIKHPKAVHAEILMVCRELFDLD
ncbi:hypothetical protein [Clostridium sp. AM58-1XD]|uniref:hypothetical protein n=1 Tax=Clostridium sp. AM58-1XD TaxID=2292307 RepID=UPI000E51C7EC|nr:hypothetical protein [Clostridium sp. AM58-1XD]RGZ00176.1 hypothetical protein DXA13_06090 [Clostridium sp. AM58-1XD]